MVISPAQIRPTVSLPSTCAPHQLIKKNKSTKITDQRQKRRGVYEVGIGGGEAIDVVGEDQGLSKQRELNQITELDEEIGCQSSVRTHKILAIGGQLDEVQPFPSGRFCSHLLSYVLVLAQVSRAHSA
jgi:hypothetical protein